jgi:2,5-diketo-D-gluconate reductase A
VTTTARLNDGREMPLLGFGTWQIPNDEAAGLVQTAIAAGYRLIDTASIYRNEGGVGEGIRAAGTGLWLTTKLWNDDQGAAQTRVAAEKSLKRLGVDSVDLYLIHWPLPAVGRYVETWRALIELREAGLARSIGVSNFYEEHLDRLEAETGVIPAVNQVELHPAFQQRDLADYHARKGIVTQSWSPLGQGQLLRDERIGRIAAMHGRTPAQIIIAWHLAQGFSVIPKSANPERIAANFAATELTLDAEDMAVIAAMDDPNGRVGPDPRRFT